METWLDAQLPPSLALWLTVEMNHVSYALRDLGLRDATDIEIFQRASWLFPYKYCKMEMNWWKLFKYTPGFY